MCRSVGRAQSQTDPGPEPSGPIAFRWSKRVGTAMSLLALRDPLERLLYPRKQTLRAAGMSGENVRYGLIKMRFARFRIALWLAGLFLLLAESRRVRRDASKVE